jgi:hypothetical protein
VIDAQLSGPAALRRRPLLDGAIDYAGLFPPAGLEMATAVANFVAYRAGPDAWALGRFVVPVARLPDFERALAALGTPPPPLAVSAILGTGTAEDVAAIETFNLRAAAHGARIESVEAKATSPGEARRVLGDIPGSWVRYLEVPVGTGIDPVLDALVAGGAFAKIRTGGTTPEGFPPSGELASALVALARRKLPFKATAGLHHPVTGQYLLTYDREAPRGRMYGYLNLMAAAGLAWDGAPAPAVERALLELDPAAREAMTRARSGFLHGFGSCSFREPLDEFPGAAGIPRP